jgi:outer membrane protein, multidrug efflux system
MRRSTSQRLWSSLRIGLVVSLAGCSIMPVKLTQEEITTRAAADHQHLADGQEPVAGPIDLYEAMARALKYNLEARVEFTHKALAETQLGLAHYNMLPRLAANAGFDGRNNFTGGVAQSLITGRQVLEPFTSAERNIFSADLALSWNVLDFGLSYVRAKQAADDVLIAEEERRRVANRVIQEVRVAYWKAVSAERIMPSLIFLDEWVQGAIEHAKAIQSEKLNNPLVPLQYRMDLLNTQRYIQQLYRNLLTAKLELAALMNILPGEPFVLMVPEREQDLPVLPTSLEVLETQALEYRPELRAIDYRRRINAKEAKIAILEMLPNLNLSAGGNYSSNSFLFNNHWAAYAARASWNLLSLVRYPAKKRTIEAQDTFLHTQGLALTMAVLSQVHVGVAQVGYAMKERATAKQYAETQGLVAEQTRVGWQAGKLGEQVILRERVNQVAAQLRYDAAEAEMQSAWASILTTVGRDLVPDDLARAQSVSDLALMLRTNWQANKALVF